MTTDLRRVATVGAMVSLAVTAGACAHGSGTSSAPAESSAHNAPRIRSLSRHAGSSDVERESDAAGRRNPERGVRVDADELSLSELESRARERELGGRDYPLHAMPREVRGSVDCPDVEVVEYRGEIIPYNRPIEINPRFRSRLIRFERIVRRVATEVYGRPPDRIVQFGGHSCRTVGRRGEKLSEHAFGHAIDVAGFDFDAVSDPGASDLPVERASEAFEVRLEDHWDASGGFDGRHSRFLHRLAEVLQQRGPFSTLLGPAYPNHDEMFHFDFGPEFFFRIDRRP